MLHGGDSVWFCETTLYFAELKSPMLVSACSVNDLIEITSASSYFFAFPFLPTHVLFLFLLPIVICITSLPLSAFPSIAPVLTGFLQQPIFHTRHKPGIACPIASLFGSCSVDKFIGLSQKLTWWLLRLYSHFGIAWLQRFHSAAVPHFCSAFPRCYRANLALILPWLTPAFSHMLSIKQLIEFLQ